MKQIHKFYGNNDQKNKQTKKQKTEENTFILDSFLALGETV